MENNGVESKEIITIDNKVYTVITKKASKCLGREKLINLIAEYVLQELRQNRR